MCPIKRGSKMHSAVSSEVSEGLLISLVGNVEMAVEELDNVRLQIFALAKRHGLLVEIPEACEECEMHVETIPDRPARWWPFASAAGVFLIVGFLAAQMIDTASAKHDWLTDGPPVHRVVKTLDGHFYAVTITRAKAGHPYTEWLTQREISESEITSEMDQIVH